MSRSSKVAVVRRLAWSVAAAAALTACSGDNPTEQVASAKAKLAKSEVRAAVIQLKSVLQSQPDLAEARFLLGKALLAGGEASAAVVELGKALELRHPESEVIPELARALFVEGQHQRLTDQFGQSRLDDPLALAELKTIVAQAYGAMGRRAQAQAAMEEALKAIPDYGPARLFEARLLADTGDVKGALAVVQRQLDRSPQDHEAWQLKGDLLNGGVRDPKAAMAAYRQAIAIKPNFAQAHSALMSLLLAVGDLEGAKTHLAQIKQVLPNHPQTVFFDASIALYTKDLARAQELSQVLLRSAPENPRVLQLAGAVALEQKAYLLAESHLLKALQKAPEFDVSRRLLVTTYLSLGQPGKALATVQPLLDKPAPPAAIYKLAAQAHLQAGELDAAEAAFTKAASLDPTDSRSRTALAVSKVLKGDADSGLADLERLAASASDTSADLPLIGALVRKRDFDAALKAIDNFEKKSTGQPVAANLKGRVLMMMGRRDDARAQFERALAISSAFYPARSALAQMALTDGKPDDAQRLLDEALKIDPRNTQAMLASARLKASRGASMGDIVAVFEKAIQQAPTNAGPHLALVNFLLARNDFKAALEAAQKASSALPNNPELLDALGRAQAATGSTNQAIATFGKLVQLVPQSPLPYLRMADVQWTTRDRSTAIQTLKRALSVAPDNLPAQRALVDAYLGENQTDQAIAVAREIQKQRPKEDAGYLLEGGIVASQKKWERAIDVYRQGLKEATGSSALASRLYVALSSSNQEAAASRHAAEWLRSHANDAEFRFFLGDVALAAKDFQGAETRYREVLKLLPDNALALNNVAWLMAQAKRPGAVDMARKAVALLPDRPVLMDTLAVALTAEGKVAEAVDVMRKAIALDEKNPQLRLNLAKTLIAAGDKSSAKVELQRLAELGAKFPRQGEVADLLKTL